MFHKNSRRTKKGFGVLEVDHTKAASLFQNAAEEGYIPAKTALGGCYMFGSGVEKDRSKAASLFKEAADAGDHQAMCHLAGCYKRGAGVEQNIEASKMWYSLYQQKRGAGSVNRVADGSKNITSRHNTL